MRIASLTLAATLIAAPAFAQPYGPGHDSGYQGQHGVRQNDHIARDAAQDANRNAWHARGDAARGDYHGAEDAQRRANRAAMDAQRARHGNVPYGH